MRLQDIYSEYINNKNEYTKKELLLGIYKLTYSMFTRKHVRYNLNKFNDTDVINNIFYKICKYNYIDRTYESPTHFYNYIFLILDKSIKSAFLLHKEITEHDCRVHKKIMDSHKNNTSLTNYGIKLKSTRRKHITKYLTHARPIRIENNNDYLSASEKYTTYDTLVSDLAIKKELNRCFDCLSIEDYEILELYLNAGSYTKVAKQLNVTKQCIHVRIARIFRIIRENITLSGDNIIWRT